MRKIVHDQTSLSDAKVIVDDDKSLVMQAVIASEIVHKYADGMAYKSADELEKAAWTANGRWVKVLAHPSDSHINKRADINGVMENATFRKDLNDPKTNRPCRRGIQVDVRWFKDRTPKEVIDQARSLALHDNSIGFTCEQDWTPGEFQGQKYDYVQRDICIDHLAAPIAAGRCPSPYCGISVDAVDDEAEKDCPVCNVIKEVGLLTAAKRLYIQYGADVLEVIEGHEIPLIVNVDAPDYQTHMTACMKGGKSMVDCVAEWRKAKLGSDAMPDYMTASKDAASPDDVKAQETRATKYGIAIKEGGNVTKPSQYNSVPDGEFADPVNYRYPLDESHVTAAWAYWNKPANQTQYSSEEKAKISDRIKAAMKKGGHEVAGASGDNIAVVDGNPPMVNCPKCGEVVPSGVDKCPKCQGFMPGHTLNSSDKADDAITLSKKYLKMLDSLR